MRVVSISDEKNGKKLLYRWIERKDLVAVCRK